MSLAKRILDEANEDITTTELYNTVMNNIPIILEGLEVLSKEFEYAHSDTEPQDISNLGKTYQAVSNICDVLDKNGFTYFPQPGVLERKLLGKIFVNFIDFYKEYEAGFAEDDIEILNTNSKDLLSILERIK